MAQRRTRRASRASLVTLLIGLALVAAVALAADLGRRGPAVAGAPSAPPPPSPSARGVRSPPGSAPAPAATPSNVYAATTGEVRPDLRDIPPRVYVPNEHSNSVSVIDAATMTVIRTIPVGASPQHVTPSADMRFLYVNDSALTEIDPRTVTVTRRIPVQQPYNLYFTLDGRHAIVVAEDLDRLDLYSYPGWSFERSIHIPWKGIDHLDISANGSFLIATTEYAGVVLKVDLRDWAVVASAKLGSLPVDVRLSPDGSRFYVTDQGRGGVIVVDPQTMTEKRFIATGRGAHGLAVSRDTRSLYVSDRLEGSITVIDTTTDRLIQRWIVGGSPDMLQVSTDGTQLWTGDRFSDTVAVIDTRSGAVIRRIRVGRSPHGVTYFPQPGNISIGHNGVYR